MSRLTPMSGALGAVAEWLVEPAAPGSAPVPPSPVASRPVIAVCGLHPVTGVTVVARALAAELAGRDPSGAAVVTAGPGSQGLVLGLPAAGRLARSLAPLAPGGSRACGRLCLVQGAEAPVLADAVARTAPLVIDVTDPAGAAGAAALADGVVVVAGRRAEPALAAVVAESLERTGPAPVVVVNRVGRAEDSWSALGALCLPDSRLAARAAASGHPARGAFGRRIATLADGWVAR